MGRLFWKFFLAFWLSLLTAGVGVGTLVWLHKQSGVPGLISGPREAFQMDTAAAVLRHGGTSALRALLEEWQRGPAPPLFAVDTAGHELLARPLTPGLARRARASTGTQEGFAPARLVTAPDGSAWLLFVPDSAPPATHPAEKDAGHPRPLPFLTPVLIGLLASLVFSALLARYLATPIRRLRESFAIAAAGDLAVRATPGMGRRRDELADLGQEFDRMAERLRVLMEARRRLLHDVSHELRSPLARLQVAVELTRQNPQRLEASLERIEKETERLDGLVGELLTLSRLEAGTSAEAPAPTDLVDLVAEVAEDARFEAAADGREVVFDGEGEIVLSLRPEMLRRAVENLVRNALRFTPPGGTVQVSVLKDPGGQGAAIRVDDQGPGVQPDALERMFTPFWRDAQLSPDGFGLGLAIARRAVEAHGGGIRAENLAAGGLRMEIRLPAPGDASRT